MFVQQFFAARLARGPYLLGVGASCAAVDPGRDVS
jgi:hypothetical protein